MNKTKLIEEFTNAVEHLAETKENATYHWYLDTDENNNDWSVVLGWADGFDKEENDNYSDGTYRLCAKLAYQSHNSIMQCDYELDWDMLYDEEEVITPNYNAEKIISWLLDCYQVGIE